VLVKAAGGNRQQATAEQKRSREEAQSKGTAKQQPAAHHAVGHPCGLVS